MKYDLLGFGKLNFDVVDAPDGHATYVGGNIPNVLSTASRLGLKTALVARVGMDEEGEICINEMKLRGVDTSYIEEDGDPTCICNVKVTEDGDRILDPLPAKKTSYSRSKHKALIKNSRIVLLGRDTINFEECTEDCKKADIPWASSLQFAKDPQSEGLKRLAAHPPGILFASEEEAIVGKSVIGAVLANGGKVIVTFGSGGAAVMSGKTRNMYRAFKAKVADTMGAGDAFTAGYLFGTLKGFSEEHTATVANAVGALAVSEKGTVPSINWKTVQKFIKMNSPG